MQNDAQLGANVQEVLDVLQNEKILKDFRDAFENEEDLQEFATRATVESYDQGTQVLTQGDIGEHFFIVLEGQLRAIDVVTDPPHLLGYFSRGAIIGERVMLGKPTRTATVEVVSPQARVAFFHKDDWNWLLGKNSRFHDYFSSLAKRRIQQSSFDFPGRQWDEVVVAATKRHYIAFVATLWLPLTLCTVPILFVIAAEISGVAFATAVSDWLSLLLTLPFIFFAILLTLYNYFDWRNDDFIVTTKRVIHIERILFFGEQRRDAPLTRIQDVTMLSDILDKIFDSDNMRITTAGVGVMEFDHIRNANELHDAIFKERERAKARVAAGDVAALRKNIAKNLDWTNDLETNVMAVAEPEATFHSATKTQHYNRLIDYFVPRVKEVNGAGDDTIITWRKHYFVLLMHIFLPILAILTSIYLLLASFILWFPFGAIVAWPVQTVLMIGLFASLFWYLWEYDDWSKDVYMLTNTQIIDIEASAFRIQRSRREGTFDNIQGVYSEVPNLLYKVINMGNVVIETAGTQDTFTFKQVFNPASVNREIFNRWAMYQQRERELNRDSTTNQVIEVLKEYHQLSQKEHQ